MTAMLPADLAGVMEIEGAEPHGWTRAQFEAELAFSAGLALVARLRDNGRVAGFVCGRIMADESEILKIGVHPAWRRRGLASALLGLVLDRLRRAGARQCFLELRISNRAALGLYEKLGFDRLGVRRGYYDHPREDAVVMGLGLG